MFARGNGKDIEGGGRRKIRANRKSKTLTTCSSLAADSEIFVYLQVTKSQTRWLICFPAARPAQTIGQYTRFQASLPNREMTAKGQSPKFTLSNQKVGNIVSGVFSPERARFSSGPPPAASPKFLPAP